MGGGDLVGDCGVLAPSASTHRKPPPGMELKKTHQRKRGRPIEGNETKGGGQKTGMVVEGNFRGKGNPKSRRRGERKKKKQKKGKKHPGKR